MGLSDDAGAASNLGLASSQMWAPTAAAVSRLDEVRVRVRVRVRARAGVRVSPNPNPNQYVAHTLYGVKPDTAAAPRRSLTLTRTLTRTLTLTLILTLTLTLVPRRSLQRAAPDDGVRMTLFYYNQSHFPYTYTAAAQCGVAGGLNFNWCTGEPVNPDPNPKPNPKPNTKPNPNPNP